MVAMVHISPLSILTVVTKVISIFYYFKLLFCLINTVVCDVMSYNKDASNNTPLGLKLFQGSSNGFI